MLLFVKRVITDKFYCVVIKARNLENNENKPTYHVSVFAATNLTPAHFISCAGAGDKVAFRANVGK